MTLLSRLLSLFPVFTLGLAGLSFVWLCTADSFLTGLLRLFCCLFCLYGFPVFVHRLHGIVWPISEGVSYLKADQYSPWWGSHQIQAIYLALPALERLLRLIPGAFSSWLRLWGAEIGQQIYWTPELEIADRGLLQVGDRAVIGQGVGLYGHIIKPKKGDLLLYVKQVQIDSDVFVGAWSKLGPGAVVAADTYLPVASYLYPNQKGPTAYTEKEKCEES